MAMNCVADMLEGVKRKILDHAHIAEANSDVAASVSFSFVADGGDDPPSASVMYGSGKHRKCKPGHLRKWIGEKGEGEFVW